MFKLIIQDDEGKTTVVPLIRDEITIGRKEGNTIRLTERNVSRRHARLVKNNGNVVIEDLDSYNGIRVNGTRIAGRATVAETDRIQIGDYLLELKLDRALAATPGQPNPYEDNQRTVPMAQLGVEATPPPPSVPAGMVPRPPAVPATLPPDGAPVPLPGDGDPTLKHDGRPALAPALPAALPAVQAAASPDGPARLVCVSANFPGKEFVLDRPAMVIGRTDDNDVVVNHRSISRHHAKVVREHGRYAIVDLQSSNGVRVNGEDYGKVELRRGDLIDLGHVRLRFVEAGEDFVFSRDATVVDLSAEPEARSRAPLYIVGGVLVAAAVVAAVVMSGRKSSPAPTTSVPAPAVSLADAAVTAPQPPTDPGAASRAEAQKQLAAARAAETARDWSAMLAAASEAERLDPQSADAKSVADRARAESAAQRFYDEFAKVAKTGRVEEAARALADIPADSVYRGQAQRELDKLSAPWVGEQLKLAKALADTGKCDKIAPIEKRVHDTFPGSEAAQLIADETARCRAGAAPPKDPFRPPPKDPPPKDPVPPKDPFRPPPVFDEGKWRGLVDEARQAYLNGQYGVAIKKADEAIAMRSDDGAIMTGGLSACMLKQGEKARRYASKLSPAKKNAVKQRCAEAGVDLE
jgi:pSer/pThr/pTyr-binding forkhead associated (FHA) protein